MERIVGLILMGVGWFRLSHGRRGLLLSGIGIGLMVH